jgi:hypothetical protein
MTDQPGDRFKAEMPQIPGVTGPRTKAPGVLNPAVRLVIGLVSVLLVFFLIARLLLRPKPAEPADAAPTAQIEVATPAPDPSAALPQATESNPGIATVPEMAKPWSSKDFYIKNRLTGENVPALLIRLPTGAAAQSSGYWGFAVNSPYGNCQLEYVTDLGKLRDDYSYAAAKHPMVGNPCSRTLFDPLKMVNLPGNVWVRGGIVQGSDLRPPLGIEIKVQGKDILAGRME